MHSWRSLFSWEGRIGRLPYALTGLTLAAVKYGLDAAAVGLVRGEAWMPWDYASPLWSTHRRLGLELGLTMVVWAIPFLWVGLALSVRRCRDAGVKPVWAWLAFAPIANAAFVIVMSQLPSRPPSSAAGADESPPQPPGTAGQAALEVFRAASVGALVALPVVLVLAQLAKRYSASLFVGGPFVVGLAAGWQLAAGGGRITRRRLVSLSALTGALAGGALLLVALEGIVCLVMAVPLSLPVIFLGACLGAELNSGARGRRRHVMPALVVPLMGGLSPFPAGERVARPVSTTVEIHAPREVVWRHVLSFGELPPPRSWLFRLSGIAHPRRATLDGEGVGAVRHCHFSTGTFVEPITEWRPGEKLAFDVASSPPSLREWSPYAHLHPPHLDGGFTSRAGSFALADNGRGGTCLTGTTLYAVSLEPVAYWRLWSNGVVHRIHLAVLEHIKALSEAAVADGGDGT